LMVSAETATGSTYSIIKMIPLLLFYYHYHSPAFTSLRILRFNRSRFSALMWLM
jgi:hypothetical protein